MANEEQLGLEGITPLPQRFTIAQAAEATGKSVYVIRRAIKAGKIQTTRNPLNDAYEMTLEELLKAGFDLKPTPSAQSSSNTPDTSALEARIKDLEEQLARERANVAREQSEKDRLFKLLEELPRALGAGSKKRWRFGSAKQDR